MATSYEWSQDPTPSRQETELLLLYGISQLQDGMQQQWPEASSIIGAFPDSSQKHLGNLAITSPLRGLHHRVNYFLDSMRSGVLDGQLAVAADAGSRIARGADAKFTATTVPDHRVTASVTHPPLTIASTQEGERRSASAAASVSHFQQLRLAYSATPADGQGGRPASSRFELASNLDLLGAPTAIRRFIHRFSRRTIIAVQTDRYANTEVQRVELAGVYAESDTSGGSVRATSSEQIAVRSEGIGWKLIRAAQQLGILAVNIRPVSAVGDQRSEDLR